MAEDLFGDIPAAPAPKAGPDMEVALKFLRRLRPGRAVHNLVARKPDTFITLDDGRTIPDIKGVTLDARDEEGIRDFIRKHTARGCDLYYSVNEVSPHTGHKKASADTIVRLHGVYIDVDPRKAGEGENPAEVFAQERWRLMDMAKALAADLVAPPTYIVDSGSGIQAVWLVEKPVDKTELLEARFRAHCYGAYTLHREAGADSTVYNIDRILRLPGTVNFQSEKKRKQGRQEAPTRLLSWTGGRYSVDALDAVSPYVLPPRSGGSGGAGAVKCDWPLVEGVAELADLDEEVRERLAAWRSADSKNEALWSGRFRDGGALDETGSGLSFTLIGRLKRSGLFSVTEAGMLCRAWGLAGDHPVDARDLERCWGRSAEGHAVTTAEDDFDVVDVGAAVEAKEAKEAKVRERREALKARRQAEGLGGETADGEGGASSVEAKPSEKPKDLPEIKWSGAALPAMVDKMTEYLRPISRKYPMLAFGGGVATISMRPPTTVKQVDGSTFPPAPMVDLLRLDSGRDLVMRRIQFKTKKQQTAKQAASGEAPEWKVSIAPTEAIQTFLARKGKGLYPLTGILDAPTLRPNGSLLWAPGYDKGTGLWGVFKADEFPAIPERPTHEQAVEAFNWIKREVFEGFPFKDEMALDIAVAALLTAMVRRVLDTAPGFGFSASSVSSGKTAIAALICQVATGRPAAVATLAKDEAEVAKMLLSILKEGQPVILYDNVPDGESVRSPELAKVMTNEMYTSRVLSVSETATVPTNALWLFSGNNISFVNDMATRVLTSYLMPSEARPDLRRFRRDLKTWCSENRGKAVAAALTVLRGWSVAKAEGAKVACNGSRFTEWLAMVGEAVVWAGGSDVTEGFTVAVEENPERAAMETLAAALVEIGGRHGAKAIMEMGREDFDDDEDSPTTRLAGAIQSLCPGPRKSPEALAVVLRKFRNAKLTVGRLVSAKNSHSKRDEWFIEPEG